MKISELTGEVLDILAADYGYTDRVVKVENGEVVMQMVEDINPATGQPTLARDPITKEYLKDEEGKILPLMISVPVTLPNPLTKTEFIENVIVKRLLTRAEFLKSERQIKAIPQVV